MLILSDKLRERREELGYSLSYVAESLNVRDAVIARLENPNAKKKITPKVISGLAQVLQCSISDFIDWNAEDPLKAKALERQGMFTLYDGTTFQVGKFPKAAQDEVRDCIRKIMEKYDITIE